MRGFDSFGNYKFGITEQIAFPEIDYDNVNTISGMNLTIVTTAKSKEESHSLLKFFGFPINDRVEKVKKEVSVEEAPSEEDVKGETTEEIPEEKTDKKEK